MRAAVRGERDSALFIMRKYVDSILFPVTCSICGNLTHADRALCDYCMEYNFEPANPEGYYSCSGHFPPDYIEVQDALWKYDKKGHLQSLLMKLKYSGRRDIGFQCGRLLGRKWRYSSHYVPQSNWLLVPVPLHWAKYWKRGYNQAALIAQGFSDQTGVPVCPSNTIFRNRFTRTQTGFTLEERQKNIKHVFEVNKPQNLHRQRIIIIDDVFTTGATTYELAGIIAREEVKSIMIYTIGVA